MLQKNNYELFKDISLLKMAHITVVSKGQKVSHRKKVG